jgi:DnaK suppressor protein
MELRILQACAQAFTILDLGGVERHNAFNYRDCKLSVRFPVELQSSKGLSRKGGDMGGAELPPDYKPSEDEPFMGERQRAYFRKKLLTWRDEILRESKETLDYLQDSEQHPDVTDRASYESDRGIELRARDRQRKLIAKIDAALVRIDDGSYGYCEETGEPIGVKRLDARPVATLSLEAQERHERRERIYRDD